LLITLGRQLADIVAEDVFFARRALEIYELDDASDVRFDYGYIHPDQDLDLQPVARVQACMLSVAQLSAKIATWNDIYLRLNAAQASGFDVVHPALSVSITDPTALAHLATSGELQFTIDSSMTPSSIFELKVNTLTLELAGATAASPATFWIEHSGHWKMAPRPNSANKGQKSLVEFNLFPHKETFNCNAGQGTLNAAIPAQAQSAAEPGPPFSFWGRGVMADWRIYPDPAATGLDLSKLTAIKLSFNCIGLAAQGATVPSGGLLQPAATLLPARNSTPGVKAAAA